jgi:hypothetical protein
MRNDETRHKLDELVKAERRLDINTAIAAVIGGLLFIAVLFYPGENVGRTTGVVRWSEIVIDEDTGRSHSSMIAELPDGRRVQASAPYKPPPVPGSTVALQVRRTWYGYTYYRWLWDERALTPAPDKL